MLNTLGKRVAAVTAFVMAAALSLPAHSVPARPKIEVIVVERGVVDAATTLAAYDGVVVLKSYQVRDFNGDGDGYPDTNETFDLAFSVSNKSAVDLTNLVARISTGDPRIDCIVTPLVAIGNVPAGADVDVPAAFRLHVHPDADRGGAAVVCDNSGPSGTCSNFVVVAGGCATDADCRRTVFDDYRLALVVRFEADQFAVQARPETIWLDLDLNSNQPSVSTTTFLESFESGFGSFTFMNLDADLASNSGSNGARCQYNDPDYPNSDSYGDTECYLGLASGQSPVNAWHIHGTTAPDGGRAFLGVTSLHYGTHTTGNPGLDTYQMGQMDAIRSKLPVHLAARVCQADPAPNKRSCNTAVDCSAVGGGPCAAASPQLSFEHQISLVDSRSTSTPLGQTADRAVLHAQIVGSSTWEKIIPYENVHDVLGTNSFSNCSFDPTDDGNTEDDLFDPPDPVRRLGPSSTCFPEFVFAYLGDTDAPFNPVGIGRASDGPGLQGSLGIGTWVESKVDLSRFRGRSIRLRFVVTSLQVTDRISWEDIFHWNPRPFDDGWYIDDVRVSQTLGATSSTVTLDAADNGALPGNMDGDARGDECDCAPSDPSVFAVSEVTGLRLDPDRVTLRWDSAMPTSGAATVHDVVRGVLAELPVGEGPGEICLVSATTSATAMDPENPSLGSGFWYLVRSRNSCGGTYGFRSNGTERMTEECP